MALGELKPAVPFAGKHARDFQDQSREFRHLVVRMPGELLEASNILGRDSGLAEKPVQLVASFDGIPFFARQSLALFAYVNPMAAAAEFLVWTGSAANSAIMSQVLRVTRRWNLRALCVGPRLRFGERSSASRLGGSHSGEKARP